MTPRRHRPTTNFACDEKDSTQHFFRLQPKSPIIVEASRNTPPARVALHAISPHYVCQRKSETPLWSPDCCSYCRYYEHNIIRISTAMGLFLSSGLRPRARNAERFTYNTCGVFETVAPLPSIALVASASTLAPGFLRQAPDYYDKLSPIYV